LLLDVDASVALLTLKFTQFSNGVATSPEVQRSSSFGSAAQVFRRFSDAVATRLKGQRKRGQKASGSKTRPCI
jgi:hypothetical protein